LSLRFDIRTFSPLLLLCRIDLPLCELIFYALNPYKASGLDGFQPIFYRSYCNIVGDEVWQLVAKAFAIEDLPPKLVETLIVPIPKIDNPTSLKEFRPISL